MSLNKLKTTRAISCAAITALVGFGLLAGCDSSGAQGTGENALVDTGPNAQLSNKELAARALSDMKALNSFEVNFTEELKDLHWDPTLRSYQPGTTGELSSTMTITARIQAPNKGNYFKILYNDSEDLGPDQEASFQTGFLRSNHITDLILTEKELYVSTDGGKGWIEEGPGSAGFILLPVVQYVEPFGMRNSNLGNPDYLGYIIKGAVFADGKPGLEEIEGTITRHMVATLDKATPGATEDPYTTPTWWYERVDSLEMWVSTGAEPRIARMNIVVRSKIDEFLRQQMKLPDQVLYNLEWTFSRFNEDLGMIDAPLPSALFTPSP
ncbi:MAG: hypothetical protein ABI670_21800 [Chloroflexota bacterium]